MISIQTLATTLGDARRYLDKVFPPPQMVAMGVVVAVSYFLYGRIARTTAVDYEILAAALTVVIVFLQIRLVEDVDIHWSGGELVGRLGRFRPPTYRGHSQIVLPRDRAIAKPSTLWAATATTTAVVAAVNIPIGASALAAGLAGTALLIISYGLLRWRPVPRVIGLVPFFEGVPAVALTYVYFVYRATSDHALAAVDVLAVAGTFWVVYASWKFSRAIGKYDKEGLYGLSHLQACAASLILMGCALALQVLLWSRADLSIVYLVYAIAVTAAFTIAIARTVATLRRQGGQVDRVPRWAGLTFVAAVLAGIGVQLVALAL